MSPLIGNDQRHRAIADVYVACLANLWQTFRLYEYERKWWPPAIIMTLTIGLSAAGLTTIVSTILIMRVRERFNEMVMALEQVYTLEEPSILRSSQTYFKMTLCEE